MVKSYISTSANIVDTIFWSHEPWTPFAHDILHRIEMRSQNRNKRIPLFVSFKNTFWQKKNWVELKSDAAHTTAEKNAMREKKEEEVESLQNENMKEFSLQGFLTVFFFIQILQWTDLLMTNSNVVSLIFLFIRSPSRSKTHNIHFKNVYHFTVCTLNSQLNHSSFSNFPERFFSHSHRNEFPNGPIHDTKQL